MSNLNFHHLRHFWVVAREGSVSRAAAKLHVTQPTISEQLAELADQLGTPLFRREGRNLVLTEVGEAAARVADEIFALGDRLVDTVRGKVTGRPLRLAVGISDGVPKSIAHRILEPALEARVQLTCREGTPGRLLAELQRHALDVVIADAPSHGPGTHDHLLGECGIAIWGTKRRAAELRVGFPRSLDGAPFLLPSANTGFRRELDAWFLANKITPHVVGELDDDALLATMAEAGAGMYAAPDAIALARRPRGLVRTGAVRGLRAHYYAVTVDRKLVHPAVSLVTGAARTRLFGKA